MAGAIRGPAGEATQVKVRGDVEILGFKTNRLFSQ